MQGNQGRLIRSKKGFPCRLDGQMKISLLEVKWSRPIIKQKQKRDLGNEVEKKKNFQEQEIRLSS